MQYRCAKFIATRYLQSAGERNVTNHGENNEIFAYCCRFCSDRLRI